MAHWLDDIYRVVPGIVKKLLCKLAFPSLTQEQIDALVNPCAGKVVFNITTGTPQYFDGTDWVEFGTGGGGGGVTSVNGDTGPIVVLDKTDIGLSNVDNTSDLNKPISTATQTALDLKAPLASPTFTGTVSGITSTMVGLGNVNNTSDANKPVSTAQQTALDTKFTQNGNSFGGAAVLGTNDVNTLAFETNNTTAVTIGTAQNVAIGGAVVVGQKLRIYTSATDPIALFAKANAGAVGTYVYRAEASGTTNILFAVDEAGSIYWGNQTAAHFASSSGTIRVSSNTLTLQSTALGSSASTAIALSAVNNKTHTSGTATIVNIDTSFTAATGSGIFTLCSVTGTINQTGSASGITRGLYINVTNTASVDYRAIETTSGKVMFSTVSGTGTRLVQAASTGEITASITYLTGSATLDFPSTAGTASSDLTITVTGAASGDTVMLGVPNGSVTANSCYFAWVSAANTVTVRFTNFDVLAADPSSGTFNVKILK